MSHANIVRDRNYSYFATFLFDANYVRLFLSVFLFKSAGVEICFLFRQYLFLKKICKKILSSTQFSVQEIYKLFVIEYILNYIKLNYIMPIFIASLILPKLLWLLRQSSCLIELPYTYRASSLKKCQAREKTSPGFEIWNLIKNKKRRSDCKIRKE